MLGLFLQIVADLHILRHFLLAFNLYVFVSLDLILVRGQALFHFFNLNFNVLFRLLSFLKVALIGLILLLRFFDCLPQLCAVLKLQRLDVPVDLK
jgi:hypothetical protein